MKFNVKLSLCYSIMKKKMEKSFENHVFTEKTKKKPLKPISEYITEMLQTL